MTRVNLPQLDSGASASTTSDSSTLATPRSDSGLSLSSAFRSGLSTPTTLPAEERIIPSIEDDLNEEVVSTSSTDIHLQNRTPSVSLSPPPESSVSQNGTASRSQSQGGAPLRNGSETLSIDGRLQALQIASQGSSMGMASVAEALDDVTSGRDRRASPLLDPDVLRSGSASPLERGAHRRRSSSRTNLEFYDPREETVPTDRFHDPTFQDAFAKSKSSMADLSDILNSSTMQFDPDSVMKRLQQEVADSAHFQSPSTRTVAFVGDSGTGKSSLLNSLLDYRDLARASNGGTACTCVATEYHYHSSDDFYIDTEIFSLGEVNEQLKSLLVAYRQYHLNFESSDAAQRMEFKQSAEVARDTFRAMFRGRLTDESILTSRPESAVLGTLQSWAKDFLEGITVIRERQSTREECALVLMRLTSEQSSAAGPSIWPYTRKISVSLNAFILSKGLVLVDLPGLRDTNSARRHITERYLLKECDEIFVVCDIGRAVTDEGVSNVFELAKRANLQNVSIVCTRSDEIRATEAMNDEQGRKARDIKERIDAVERDRLEIGNLRANLAELDDFADEWTDEEAEEHRTLSRRLRQTERRFASLTFELTRHIVENRNVKVSAQLLLVDHNQLPNGSLRVFCVSNSFYWDNRDLPKHTAEPYINLSGIPKLRQRCMAIVSDNQYHAAMKFMQDDISALIGDVELWVQSGSGSISAERKQRIRETLDVLENKLRDQMCGNKSEINHISRSLKTRFRNAIYNKHLTHSFIWSNHAQRCSQEWACWPAQTYIAFVSKYGIHTTKSAGWHNWNEEMIQAMTKQLKPHWAELKLYCREQCQLITILINSIMEWAEEFLDIALQDGSDPKDTLCEAMVCRQHLIIDDVETAWEEFGDHLMTLGIDTLSGIRTSFVGQAMEKSYELARSESGTGCTAIKKGIIDRAVRREGLFKDILRNSEDDFGVIAEDLQKAVLGAIRLHLEAIRKTLNIVRSKNTALESEKDPDFRARVSEMVQTTKGKMSQIRNSLGSAVPTS